MTAAKGALQRARAARKRRERAESRSAWRAAVMERDEGCRFFDYAEFWWNVPPLCTAVLEAHHLLPRGRGGRDELENGLALCSAHHQYVTEHPEFAYEVGLLRRSGT